MANTLTNLIPAMTRAADTVGRELVGLVPSVYLNSSAEQAAKNQLIYYPVTGTKTTSDIAPAATGPDPADESVGNGSMSITKVKKADVGHWDGEEQLGLGTLYEQIIQDEFAQAFRALVNEMEADGALLYYLASRAYGTAGTTPFGTAGNFTDASQVRKILVDNGAPQSELKLVVNTSAGANIRGLQAQAHIAGGDSLQRNGIIQSYSGVDIRESAAIVNHVAGTGANATTNAAGYAVGDKTVTLAAAGTGTILQGDVLSHARDTRLYVVNTGDADVSNAGTFVLNNPGLRQTVTAATSALTLKASYAANMAFHRMAIHLLTRTPVMPKGGDSADDVKVIVDPFSGIAFQVALYRQYRRIAIEVGLAWGWKAVKSEHMALLLG